MDIESFARICRSRYYHGACDNPAHALGCGSRLGHIVATREEQRMGTRAC